MRKFLLVALLPVIGFIVLAANETPGNNQAQARPLKTEPWSVPPPAPGTVEPILADESTTADINKVLTADCVNGLYDNCMIRDGKPGWTSLNRTKGIEEALDGICARGDYGMPNFNPEACRLQNILLTTLANQGVEMTTISKSATTQAPVVATPDVAEQVTTPATATQKTDPCDKPVDPSNPITGINTCGDSLAKFAKAHPETE
jgi:hypothetical protein